MRHPIIQASPAAVTAVMNTRTGREQGYTERSVRYVIRVGAVGAWLSGETVFDVYGANLRITNTTETTGTPVLTVDAA